MIVQYVAFFMYRRDIARKPKMNADDDVNRRLVYTGLLCVAITYSMHAGKSQNVAEKDLNIVLQSYI